MIKGKIKRFVHGFVNEPFCVLSDMCREATEKEIKKSPQRYDVINWFLEQTSQKRYLEIGVRDLDACFNRIKADYKVSVDPGYEADVNLADVKLTSDEFFDEFRSGKLSLEHAKFDVIFIDGLHLADQVYRDILNSLEIIASPGYIVMHDCNPPTRFHAREDYHESGPASGNWNGTTWKAFQKIRTESTNNCFVIDTDWGLGVVESHNTGEQFRLDPATNPFFEYAVLEANRKKILNLVDFQTVQKSSS
jgi:hypothetical protein